MFWDFFFIDGGFFIINYIIEKRDVIKRIWFLVLYKCFSIIFKVKDLLEKILFFFRVFVENEIGIGEFCEIIELVKVVEVLVLIRDFLVKDLIKIFVILSWIKFDFDGGSVIIEYVVERKGKGE